MVQDTQGKHRETLDKMAQDGVIADADKPTYWVSNLAVAQKKDRSLRLCLDPKSLSVVIKKENYIIPTPGGVQAGLHSKKVFTVIDIKMLTDMYS